MTSVSTPRDDALAATAPATPRVVRAVYGLVDDQYGVVAHTPNVTREAAHELCRAVGIGDPTAPIEDALSFLEVKGWGVVCTRYATRLDARGRLAIVSDSVAVDAASFRALRADPFRCVPRRGDLASADSASDARTLDVPRFTASTPSAELARLTDARSAVDEVRELRPLLAALLAGERVLWISPSDPPSAAALQCLVLLLPPSLRRLMTFQTAATRAPHHAPRLTAADRRYAELGTVAWTRELPRELGVANARADAAADALLALSPDALAAAHARYEQLSADDAPAAPPALLGDVERVLRAGAFDAAVSRRDALGAVRAAASDARDAASLLALSLESLDASAIGAAVTQLLAERTSGSVEAGARALAELLRIETGNASQAPNGGPDASAAARALDAALAGVDDVRWTADAPARQARATLALLAARRGDADRLVALADVDAPWWEHAPVPRGARAEVRLTGTVVAALAHARAGDADAAAAALDAIGALPLGTAARRDAAGLGLAVASLAVATAAAHVDDRGTGGRLRRLAGALLAFWDRVPPADARGEALRRLLAGEDGDARQLDASSPDERAGWIAAAALGALATRGSVDALAAAARPEPALARVLGAVLREEAPDGPPLGDGWPALLAHVDPDARRELLGRSLDRATRSDVSLGTLAAACDALVALDFQLDSAAATRLGGALARWATTLPPTRTSAARLGGALALLGELADADAAESLRAATLRDTPEPLRVLVQLRRLVSAAADVEATRDPTTWDTLRAAVRAGADALLPAQLASLRAFLGVRKKK